MNLTSKKYENLAGLIFHSASTLAVISYTAWADPQKTIIILMFLAVFALNFVFVDSWRIYRLVSRRLVADRGLPARIIYRILTVAALIVFALMAIVAAPTMVEIVETSSRVNAAVNASDTIYILVNAGVVTFFRLLATVISSKQLIDEDAYPPMALASPIVVLAIVTTGGMLVVDSGLGPVATVAVLQTAIAIQYVLLETNYPKLFVDYMNRPKDVF